MTDVIWRQTEAESFVRVKVEFHSRLGHVEEDPLVLPHALTNRQMNFCIQRILIYFLIANFSLLRPFPQEQRLIVADMGLNVLVFVTTNPHSDSTSP